MMRFALLGSGSEGNALVVQAGATTLLMDCGFPLNETLARLARLGLEAGSLDGILITHEHGDHISGVAKLARRFNLLVWGTHGTLRAQAATFDGLRIIEINPHLEFVIGDVDVRPYVVPHDATEPVQYVFGHGTRSVGVLTDAGHITPHVESALAGCTALVLECNHDAEMLRNGRYPESLKQRVGGHYGHLSNRQAAELLGRLQHDGLQHVVAAHLSKQNNLPALAVEALSMALGCSADWIAVADQETGLDWREVV